MATLVRTSAWLVTAVIVFITVCPIAWRPVDIASVNFDRAAAFALLSCLFVIAYPKRLMVCAITIVASAGLIELLQFLSPTRHPHFDDAGFKASGALIGCIIATVANRFFARTSPFSGA